MLKYLHPENLGDDVDEDLFFQVTLDGSRKEGASKIPARKYVEQLRYGRHDRSHKNVII